MCWNWPLYRTIQESCHFNSFWFESSIEITHQNTNMFLYDFSVLWQLSFEFWRFKEAAPKSSVYGGVKTFSNKKGLVGRMTMIQSALDSSDLGEYFRYPQRHEKVYRKFFRDVWSQKLRQKVAKSRNFEASFWTWKNGFLRFPCFCAFSLRLIHRMIMNQRALDTSGPGEHFKYQ